MKLSPVTRVVTGLSLFARLKTGKAWKTRDFVGIRKKEYHKIFTSSTDKALHIYTKLCQLTTRIFGNIIGKLR